MLLPRPGAAVIFRAVYKAFGDHTDTGTSGPNLYAYVNQNPWSKFDPEGLSPAWAVHNITGAWDPKIHAMEQSREYQEGFRKGAGMGAAMGAGLGVGVLTTVYTGGAAGPVVTKLLGDGALATFTTAGIAGFTGGAAGQMTTDVLSGQPVTAEKTLTVGAWGAGLNVAGTGLGLGYSKLGEFFRSKPAAGMPEANVPVGSSAQLTEEQVRQQLGGFLNDAPVMPEVPAPSATSGAGAADTGFRFFHYSQAEIPAGAGLNIGSCVTDAGDLTVNQAMFNLGIPPPNYVYPVNLDKPLDYLVSDLGAPSRTFPSWEVIKKTPPGSVGTPASVPR